MCIRDSCGICVFLRDDLKGIGYPGGQDSRIDERHPCRCDLAVHWLFTYEHRNSAQNPADKKLNTGKTDSVHLRGEIVNNKDMNRKYDCT